MNITSSNTAKSSLLEANYKYIGLIGGIIWAVILLATNVSFELFFKVFLIVLFIIVFNILNARIMAIKDVDTLRKIITAVINIPVIALLIYYTGGMNSNLWVMYLLVLLSFSMIYSKNEMLAVLAFVVIIYSLVYFLKSESFKSLPINASSWIMRTGVLLFAGVSFKKIVDFHKDYTALHEELHTTNEQLMHVGKLSELGQMISSLAHEINNPLTSIIGFSQFVINSECNDEVKNDAKLIHENAIWCRDIIRNILMFCQKKENQEMPVNVNDILRDAINFRSFMGKDSSVCIVKKLGENLPLINADPYKLKEVFVNIINNAYDAMAEQEGKTNELTIESECLSNKIIIKFIDTGPGIKPEIKSKIFESFFTTKKEKGTGLGLSISRDILRQYGGEILVESEEHVGTIFNIGLPVN